MTITVREAIDKTLRRVALATGSDTQTYADDQIQDIIQHKFNLLFDSYWWDQFYTPSEGFTLDGATGVVTEDLSAKIKRFMDIRTAWHDTWHAPLPRLNTRANPRYATRPSIAPFPGPKVFRIYPFSTSGTVWLAYRTKPDPFLNEDDEINMDEDLIVLGSAYDYLNSLGTNPEEEAKLLQFFNNRLKQFTDLMETREVSTGNYYDPNPNGWQDDPRYP